MNSAFTYFTQRMHMPLTSSGSSLLLLREREHPVEFIFIIVYPMLYIGRADQLCLYANFSGSNIINFSGSNIELCQ